MRRLEERRIDAHGVTTQTGRGGRSVSVNVAESPLSWLAARGLVDARQLEAGERLRGDYERAQLAPSVTMRWDAACPWVQVHTADQPDPQRSRLGLAVEPMTCPPDAFNSGTDLIVLQPGESTTAGWTIAAV